MGRCTSPTATAVAWRGFRRADPSLLYTSSFDITSASRRLTESVVQGEGLTSAVIKVFEELETAPGQVVPIGKPEDGSRQKVSIDGRVETLWEPAHPSIAQVELITDESGRLE